MRIAIVGFIVFFFFVLPIILIRVGKKQRERDEIRQRRLQYMEASDKLISAISSNSIKRVKESINQLDYEYTKVQDVMNTHGDGMYQEDRKMLVEQLRDLEQAKWEKKADRYLQEFLDYYMMLEAGDFQSFQDVEQLFKAKKRCIDLWQRYYAINLEEYQTTIYPKRYMREWMGEDYDPCMESHDALEKKLSSIVDKMRPEYKRKQALFDIIVNYVAARGSISRADLQKKKFDGYTVDEAKCCYRALIKSNRLVEVKLGSRYFVSLSDKEASKERKQSVKEEKKMIARSDKLVHDAIVKHLMDEGAEYIDMTHKGGGLYFFSEAIAEELKGKGYHIGYAEKGSRSTSGRPAWYVK